jgi:hypothetical protein
MQAPGSNASARTLTLAIASEVQSATQLYLLQKPVSGFLFRCEDLDILPLVACRYEYIAQSRTSS